MKLGTDVKAAFDMWGRFLNDIHTDLERIYERWDHPVLRDNAHESLKSTIRALEAVIKQMVRDPNNGPYYSIVEMITGYGADDVYYLEVVHWAEFLRGPGRYGTCAFCDGYPAPNDPGASPFIERWFREHPDADVCPVCEGRAT